MPPRLNANTLAPNAYQALLALQTYVNTCGIEKPLLELVKLRASQINGCAFCIAMHALNAARDGDSHVRLHLLNAWRHTTLYSARERAALVWTEALTLIAENPVTDEVYEQARVQFSDKELADLAYAVATINAWNRIAIAFRTEPQPTTAVRSA